jgi:DsbC/DsbD-like thiol-disulfide interchange protein
MVLTSTIAIALIQAQAKPTIGLKIIAGTKAQVQGTLNFTIPSGWHAYQNPPKSQFENPLQMTITTKGAKLASVSYPKGKEMGESLVYEGTVSIPFTVSVPSSVKPVRGTYSINAEVSYQLCNESTCIPPQSTTLKINWKLKK